MRMIMTGAAFALAALTLAACNDSGTAEPGAPPEPSNQTLAQSLGDFDRLEGVIANAQLEQVLSGVGPYTLFAPVDDAFAPVAQDLTDEAMRAQAAALLREHMVPGVLTRADIEAAIAADEDGAVEVRTLGDGVLTFRNENNALVVSNGDAVSALLSGEETLASNGVIQPVTTLLIVPPAPEAAPG